MTARNFDCPETETACVRAECTRARCVDAIRLAEAQANKNVRSQSLPAFRGTIAAGRWYTLRSGEKAIVVKKATARWRDGATQEWRDLSYWEGRLAGGATITWQLDGYISPVPLGRPHQCDIVGTAIRP